MEFFNALDGTGLSVHTYLYMGGGILQPACCQFLVCTSYFGCRTFAIQWTLCCTWHVCVFRYVFRSGNPEHPGDKFYNTSVQVLSSSHNIKSAMHDLPKEATEFPLTEDHFYIISHFNHESGVAEGVPPVWLGPVDVLRLYVQHPSSSWAILNEVDCNGVLFEFSWPVLTAVP